MDLGGRWLAAEADEELRRRAPDPGFVDAGWEPVDVPGQWRAVPAFAASDGPILHRRRFDTGSDGDGRRWWLTFEGIFYQADVWLDGSYLGDTEGYFAPRTFEVTDQVRQRRDHLLAVEVGCPPPADRRRKRSLTGVFQHWDCLDPGWNPGGIWAPVRLDSTGPVRIGTLRVLCADARPQRAVLHFDIRLDAAVADAATLRTEIRREGRVVATAAQTRPLAAGRNRAHWRVTVERPDLWWPHALGEQPLYEVDVAVESGGERSDGRTITTGLRRIALRQYVATVNGERLFLKGANLGPARRALSEVTPVDVARDLALARGAGLDLLRVHAHIGPPALYEEADRTGVLLWQDLPLQWGYGPVRRQAVRQARRAVNVLGHHPSVALWCGHNEPIAVDLPRDGSVPGREVARFVAGQLLPTWNKTALDRSIRRALERADGSRPVVAHSGVLPHPAWGTDTHAYFGWYHGDERDLPRVLARWPALARFVGEFGAQAAPDDDELLPPSQWPDLDWAALEQRYGLQKHVFDRRVAPADHPTVGSWRTATQRYQADLVRYHVQTLRRLKYRPTGGFCVFLLADAQPAVSWALLDHRRTPKAAYQALKESCAPVIVVADRLRPAYRPGDEIDLAVHVVSDLRYSVGNAEVTAELRWPGGGRRWSLAGAVPADTCVRVARLQARIPPSCPPGPVDLHLDVAADGLPTPVPRSSYRSSVAPSHSGGR